MLMSFKYECRTCGETHQGVPSFGPDAPHSYLAVPEAERPKRCSLGSDDCVIDEEFFFVRGCLEIPVHALDEPFVWLVWCSLSRQNFEKWVDVFDQESRSGVGPFFGWLNTQLPFYPDTINLKTMVHIRDNGLRPTVVLEPTEHELAIAQADGISTAQLEEIITSLLHQDQA